MPWPVKVSRVAQRPNEFNDCGLTHIFLLVDLLATMLFLLVRSVEHKWGAAPGRFAWIRMCGILVTDQLKLSWAG